MRPGPHARIIGTHRATYDRREIPLGLVLVQCTECHRLVPPTLAEQDPHTWEWVCRDELGCWRHTLLSGEPKEPREPRR